MPKTTVVLLALAGLLAIPPMSLAGVERAKFQAGNKYLAVEFLRDDLVHFELSGQGPGPGAETPIPTTPQVFKTDYTGPGSFNRSGNILETPDVRLSVDGGSLCFTLTDKKKSVELTTVCPLDLSQASNALTVSPGAAQHVYGLGEQFITPGQPDGDWTGRVRTPGDNFGNQMVGFNGGAVGNAQYPVMYAVGANDVNYALFLDHIYKQTWNFSASSWRVDTLGDQVRGYLMTGPNLPDLRRDFMDLVGHPPVPPRKMFGLWVSEYGYDNWQELEGKLATLRANRFPVDGFVLDLQWFGGITAGSDNSNMGRVSWDSNKFPNAAGKLAEYRNQEGIGIVTIEESYISRGLPEHADLQSRGYLNRAGCSTCPPVYLTGNPWWGKGGMIDWTQDAAGDYWHDRKRRQLIRDGVIGHWIDLGEPEMYDPGDWVAGVLPGKHGQADYHNLYSFKWAESIARGYARNHETRRPFMMSRSGAAGIQRFGAIQWSGDIGSDLSNLRTHFNAQMHMSMSGMDYFGADIGGFHRQGGDPNNSYTEWFANGAMFDVPVRPHTENLCNCKETAPDRIGDKASNLANIRQRYELSPYVYSLAHRAFLEAEPVEPPLVYYYQNDLNVRENGNEKLLGRDLLVAADADPNASRRDVYLPAGDWVNYHSNEWLHSSGQTFAGQPVLRDGVFRLPTYARAGAVIPKMFVDDKTMNILGKRTDGSTRNELIVRVYADSKPSSFTLYEDDGETVAYQSGAVRTTVLSQQLSGANGSYHATVEIAAASGDYQGAPASRPNIVELVAENLKATGVALNGRTLVQLASRETFNAAVSGWFNAGNNLILAKTESMDVAEGKNLDFTLTEDKRALTVAFECRHGDTVVGQSVYAVGNLPELGEWNGAKALKLEPNGPYPTWTGEFGHLPAGRTIEWKCIKRTETGDTGRVDQWQPGPNNVLVTPGEGAVKTAGDFKGGGGSTVSARFACENGVTVFGQSVYVVGNIPALGSWTPGRAVKLEPTQYPRWTGTIGNLPPNARIEWKCIKRPESGDTNRVDLWQPGANNAFTTPVSGSSDTSGDFNR